MLEFNTKHIFVSGTDLGKVQQLNPGASKVISSTSIYNDKASQTVTQPTNFKVTHPNRFSQNLTVSQKQMGTKAYFELINNLKAKNSELIVAPFFSSQMTDKIGLSNYFYVKLKHQNDFNTLMGLIEKHNIELIGSNIFMPLWFTISVTADSKNALEMANMFYETGLFEAAEPDLMTDDGGLSAEDKLNFLPNDPLFNTQWSLKNTGQNGGTAGIDINAEDAWEIGIGDPNVVVAVLDHGFEMNHPDLVGNTVGTGYDTESNTTPAQVLGSHGTACAGIVAADGDNGVGITGVAFNASLMSISNSLGSNPNSRQARANGINWAANNGADIISNSWSSGVQYQVIDDAITNALANGRGGLGCIIVFAAGNNNGAMSYPANSNPDILAVGAMSPCGQRKSPTSCDGENWGSNFGATLDIVAPGVLMQTTDRQGGAGYSGTDYTSTFNGTSSACPVVAGVAALILGIDPTLTMQEVNNIIEMSAQKTRTDLYAYNTTGGRPNGTWNNQMGYGQVDALQAVLLARGCPSSIVLTGTVSGELTFQAGNVLISDQEFTPTANVTYHAGNNMRFNSGFSTGGGQFHASIAPCKMSNKQINIPQTEEITYVYQEKQTAGFKTGATEATALKSFPNPFQANTTLEYDLETGGPVLLVVTDINNRIITVLVDQNQDAGLQSVNFSGSELPSGVYFAKLKTGNNISIARLLITK